MNYSDEAWEKLCASVYQNDLILEKIVKNVIWIEPRRNLELSSRRLYQMSKKSGWALTTPYQRKLSIYFSNPVSTGIVTVELGDIRFQSRCAYHIPWSDRLVTHPALESILIKMAHTFGNCIDEVDISGSTKNILKDGGDNEKIVITMGIIYFINKLVNLKTLSLQNCYICENVMAYVPLPQCTFKDRIISLTLKNMKFYETKREFTTMFADMIGKNLKELKLRMNNNFYEDAVKRMDRLNIQLKKISVNLDTADETAEEVVTTLHRKCEKFELCFQNEWGSLGSRMMNLVSKCQSLPNIISFKLKVGNRRMHYIINFADIFQNFEKMENLEYLSVAEWSPEYEMDSFIYGVSCLHKLKGFKWFAKCLPFDVSKVEELMSVMPKNIESISVEDIPMTDQVLDILADKYSQTLKVLRIRNPKRCAAVKSFNTILQRFEKLEIFEFDLPLPTACLPKLLEKKSIQEAELKTGNQIPLSYQFLLRDYFTKIVMEETRYNQHILRLKHRK